MLLNNTDGKVSPLTKMLQVKTNFQGKVSMYMERPLQGKVSTWKDLFMVRSLHGKVSTVHGKASSGKGDLMERVPMEDLFRERSLHGNVSH